MTALLAGFEVENYRSFRDTKTLSFQRLARSTVDGFAEPDIAPAVAIFGPNSSGKSNLLRALGTMFSMIRLSASDIERRLPYTPYLLGELDDRPTRFEVAVRFDGVAYEYGFTYDAQRIYSEWLYSSPKSRRRLLFERTETVEWKFGDSLTGANQALAKATRDDALLLSTARVLNHEILSPLQATFATMLRSVRSDAMPVLLQSTLDAISSDSLRKWQVTQLMTRAEFGVVDLTVTESEPGDEALERTRRVFRAIMPDASAEEIEAQTRRTTLSLTMSHSGSSGPVAMPMEWESVGTRNFLALLGPVLEQLSEGGFVIVDEIDTSLHPRLVSELVRLFQSPATNPKQAQLVLSTHDVTLMMNTGDYNVLSRDQLWFVAKDDEGVSDLYPLSVFKPREHEVFSRNYLLGRYGAVPRVDDSAFDLWSRSDF